MKRKWRAALGVILAGMASAVAQTTATTMPIADAFVTTGPGGELAGSNYGGAGALAVSGASAIRSGLGSRGTFASVLRFDLASTKATFDAAYGAGLWSVKTITLTLTTASANNAIFNDNATGQFSLVWMQNDAWTPGTGTPNAPGNTGITFDSRPGFLGENDQSAGTFIFDATTSGTDGTKTTYALTLNSGVTSDVLSGGFASFEIAAGSGTMSYLFNSGDFSMGDARRPVLSVTAVAVPEPAVWRLLGLGGVGFLFCRACFHAVRS